jgi:hypothetical protein
VTWDTLDSLLGQGSRPLNDPPEHTRWACCRSAAFGVRRAISPADIFDPSRATRVAHHDSLTQPAAPNASACCCCCGSGGARHKAAAGCGFAGRPSGRAQLAPKEPP